MGEKMETCKIFVGGLDNEATEEDVREQFIQFGEIVEIFIPAHKTLPDRNRGFCFIKFESEQSSNAAIDASMAGELRSASGRRLHVDHPLPRPEAD
jgi:RNA recognition motif-containing protein